MEERSPSAARRDIAAHDARTAKAAAAPATDAIVCRASGFVVVNRFCAASVCAARCRSASFCAACNWWHYRGNERQNLDCSSPMRTRPQSSRLHTVCTECSLDLAT